MIFRSLLLGIFLISVGILNAQEIELAGIFRNEKNGAVIPFATIEIMNKKALCQSEWVNLLKL